MNLSDLQAAFPDHAVKINTFPEEEWGAYIDYHTCAAIYRPGTTLPVALSAMRKGGYRLRQETREPFCTDDWDEAIEIARTWLNEERGCDLSFLVPFSPRDQINFAHNGIAFLTTHIEAPGSFLEIDVNTNDEAGTFHASQGDKRREYDLDRETLLATISAWLAEPIGYPREDLTFLKGALPECCFTFSEDHRTAKLWHPDGSRFIEISFEPGDFQPYMASCADNLCYLNHWHLNDETELTDLLRRITQDECVQFVILSGGRPIKGGIVPVAASDLPNLSYQLLSNLFDPFVLGAQGSGDGARYDPASLKVLVRAWDSRYDFNAGFRIEENGSIELIRWPAKDVL